MENSPGVVLVEERQSELNKWNINNGKTSKPVAYQWAGHVGGACIVDQ